MTLDEIIGFVESLEGVYALRPGQGDGTPEISWGDVFFYYSPEGVVPMNTQPFATIVTKDYPGDEGSRLDRRDAFRVNIWAGQDAFTSWIGRTPRERSVDEPDPSSTDTVFAHPVYSSAGWLAVVNPGQRTAEPIREMLQAAYHRARSRYER